MALPPSLPSPIPVPDWSTSISEHTRTPRALDRNRHRATKRVLSRTGPNPAPPPLPAATQAPGIGGAWNDPSRREATADKMASGLAAGGQGELGAYGLARSNAGQAGAQNIENQYFDQYQQGMGKDSGLGVYYDDAQERAMSGMNAQLAGSGAYGSSRGLGAMGNMLGGLNAERANAEADYRLRQQELGGILAGQAGQSRRDWTSSLGELGMGADILGLRREGLALDAAGIGDQGYLDRKDREFDNLGWLTDRGLGAFGGLGQAEMDADRDAFEAREAARLAEIAGRERSDEIKAGATAEVKSDLLGAGKLAASGGLFGGDKSGGGK